MSLLLTTRRISRVGRAVRRTRRDEGTNAAAVHKNDTKNEKQRAVRPGGGSGLRRGACVIKHRTYSDNRITRRSRPTCRSYGFHAVRNPFRANRRTRAPRGALQSHDDGASLSPLPQDRCTDTAAARRCARRRPRRSRPHAGPASSRRARRPRPRARPRPRPRPRPRSQATATTVTGDRGHRPQATATGRAGTRRRGLACTPRTRPTARQWRTKGRRSAPTSWTWTGCRRRATGSSWANCSARAYAATSTRPSTRTRVSDQSRATRPSRAATETRRRRGRPEVPFAARVRQYPLAGGSECSIQRSPL